jgi:hypothetical protein
MNLINVRKPCLQAMVSIQHEKHFIGKLLETGESTLSPPQIVVTYNLLAINFFGDVWTSRFELFLLILSMFD